jgi:squalene-hopene/tetraprenyl-beta-curcumene cyclase
LLERAADYIARHGGIAGLRRRYGRDKTFAVPILTNQALAGLAPWSDVSPLPFELACLPQRFYRFVRLPVVSYAIPLWWPSAKHGTSTCRPSGRGCVGYAEFR